MCPGLYTDTVGAAGVPVLPGSQSLTDDEYLIGRSTLHWPARPLSAPGGHLDLSTGRGRDGEVRQRPQGGRP